MVPLFDEHFDVDQSLIHSLFLIEHLRAHPAPYGCSVICIGLLIAGGSNGGTGEFRFELLLLADISGTIDSLLCDWRFGKAMSLGHGFG